MAFPNRKGLHQRQIQPAETWRSHNIASGIAVFPAAGHRIEPLESGDVKPTLDGLGSVVRIGNHVRPIGRKSLDFRRASRLREVHTVIHRKRRATAEIGDAVQLPAGEDRFGKTGAILEDGQFPGSAHHPAMAGIKNGRAMLCSQVERILSQIGFARSPAGPGPGFI